MAEVGVVIVAHDGEAFIREALASVSAQTLDPVDVLVVDDGSTDRTAQFAGEHGVRVLSQAQVGPADSRNVALGAVRGDVIAFLDADDLWRPEKLQRQVAALDEDPGLGFVGSLSAVFLNPGSARPSWWKPAWSEGHPEPSLLPSATLYRRSALEQVGPFRGARSSDVDWTARAQDLGVRRAIVDEILVDRRIHGDNLSNDRVTIDRRHLEIARASIARKRASDA